jgi:hypothetical protein
MILQHIGAKSLTDHDLVTMRACVNCFNGNEWRGLPAESIRLLGFSAIRRRGGTWCVRADFEPGTPYRYCVDFATAYPVGAMKFRVYHSADFANEFPDDDWAELLPVSTAMREDEQPLPRRRFQFGRLGNFVFPANGLQEDDDVSRTRQL